MSKTKNEKIDEDTVIEHLRELRFKTSDEDLKALFQEKIDGEIGPMLIAIARLAEVERAERQVRNLDSRTRAAALGKCISLDGFDWTHPKSIDRGLYEQLLSLDFIDDSYNILFRGPSGTGKTTLAKIVGFKALQEGRTVRFTSLVSMVSELLSQESIPAFNRRLRKFTGPDLLIIDEIGYLPVKNDAVDAFFNVISQRHEINSTILTTNLSFKEWGKFFQGAACLSALVDRFVQHCHVMDIEADSWRNKDATRNADKRDPTR